MEKKTSVRFLKCLSNKSGFKSPFDYLYSYNGKLYFLCPSVIGWRRKDFTGLLNNDTFEAKLKEISKSETFPKLFLFTSIKLISLVYGVLNYFYHRYFKLDKIDNIQYPVKVGYCRIDSYEEVTEKEDSRFGKIVVQKFSTYVGDALPIISGIRDIISDYSHRNKKLRFAKVLSNLEILFNSKGRISPFGIRFIEYDYNNDSLSIDIFFHNTITDVNSCLNRKTSYFSYVMERLNRYGFFVRLYPSEFVSTQNLYDLLLLFGKNTDEKRLATLFSFISSLYSKERADKKGSVPKAWAYRIIQRIKEARRKARVIDSMKTISLERRRVYATQVG